MREMKDSGIPWIGKIPQNWKTDKINSLYTPRNQKVNDKDYPPLSVTKQGVMYQIESVAKTDDHGNRKLVKKGDFAINSRSDRRGSCGIAKYDGSVSLINIVLQPQAMMNAKYYDWLFHTTAFADEFYKWGHGIVDDLWTTRWEDMKKIMIPYPSLSTQQKIAAYLDSKCAKIDSVKKKVEAEVEALEQYKRSVITETVTKGLDKNVEMKDNGIPWIGKTPKDWNLTRIKYTCKSRSEKAFFNHEKDKYLGLENVIGFSNRIIETDTTYTDGYYDIYRNGDVLFNKLRPYLGKVIIANQDGFCTGEFIRLFDYRGDNRFLRYWMINEQFINEVNNSTYGAKMPRANPEFIMNMLIPVIPYKQQHYVANYLDSKCLKIDSVIQEKQDLLTKLDTYKKSLIYEYVTGKKEVPAV